MTKANSSPQVSKWGRFEQEFTSTVPYDNPFQAIQLHVTFTNPTGQTRTVDGFWDGGSSWRVRFSPDITGSWTFITTCSDETNTGLHQISGSLVCTPSAGKTRFDQHGPIRLSSNRRYFVHADGTPFFWLADTVWNGPLRASLDEWKHYLARREQQKFTAVQWVTTQWIGEPEGDANKMKAYNGDEAIILNPAFFQRLDKTVDATNEIGLLSVPVLLWAAGWSTRDNNWVNPGYGLPDEQAIRLARYMIARWGAHHVAWILPGDGDYRGEKAERWKHIGRAVFDQEHAPVSLHPGGMQWNMDEFRDEPWLDIVGYQSGHGDDDTTLAWLVSGPPSTDWQQSPARPFINLEPPYEDHLAYQSRKPHDAHSVRRALYWSLLVSPTAGVTYGGHGIWGWDDGSGPPTGHPNTGTARPWQQALNLPAAEQLTHLNSLINSMEWWRLRPAPKLLAEQPGSISSSKFIAAASTDEGDLAVIYTPVEGCIELNRDTLPDDISALWFDPRTGHRQSASLELNQNRYQVATPGSGDWVLVLGRNVFVPVNNGAGAST